MEDKPQKPAGEESFEALMKECQDVFNELLADKSLDKFRVGYEKLTCAMKKSHESEKRLMTKCRELNAEIVSNSVKVATALKMSQEDQTTISSLKKELEKSWKMVDSAHDKDMRAKETIQTLKLEITNLTRLVEQAGLSVSQEHSVNDLLKVKEEMSREREALLDEVVTLKQQLTTATASQQDMEAQKEKAMETISQLQQDIQVRQNESSRETRRKEKLQKEVGQLHADLEARQSDIKALNVQSQRSKEEQQRQEQQLREQKIQNERAAKELEQLQVRYTKLQQENEQHSLNMDHLSLDAQQRSSDLKMKEEEVNQMRQEIAKLTKMRDGTQRKFRQTEEHKQEVEQQRDMQKNQIVGLEREIESSKKQMEIDKKAIDELVRERDILNKNMIKAANATEKQLDAVKLHEQSKKHLDQEIMSYRDEAQKQRKIIYQLEKERDRYINEASDLTHKVLQHMEDIKVREMEIFEYKKKMAEVETKLKHLQNLYEAVRSDRNLYSRNLIEAQNEITDMKSKLKMSYLQIDQMKEVINGKEGSLIKEHLEFQRVEKEKESLKAELQKMKHQAQETKQFIDNQEAEERNLLKIIADADADRLRQKKEFDQVISERDILGTQLVQRNDELVLLYEKIKIQQSLLNKGDVQYSLRLDDLRLFKMEVKNLRREKSIQGKTVANMEDLRREVYHMQRELLKERTRCRAMEEELETPLNIHRWRKLKASDPGTYELTLKIQSLQKRLITKTKEVAEKELILQEKEKLHVELEHTLARRPGAEAAEQLQNYKRTLREKNKEIKCLTAERNMHESNNVQYKQEIDRLVHEQQDNRKKYLALKRKEQLAGEKERSLTQVHPQVQPQRSDRPCFTRGGFNVKQSPVKK